MGGGASLANYEVVGERGLLFYLQKLYSSCLLFVKYSNDSLCRIALMPREAEISHELEEKLSAQDEYYKKQFNADIIRITAPAIEISSSEIRVGDGEFRKKYLPKAVYEYITEHGLYE